MPDFEWSLVDRVFRKTEILNYVTGHLSDGGPVACAAAQLLSDREWRASVVVPESVKSLDLLELESWVLDEARSDSGSSNRCLRAMAHAKLRMLDRVSGLTCDSAAFVAEDPLAGARVPRNATLVSEVRWNHRYWTIVGPTSVLDVQTSLGLVRVDWLEFGFIVPVAAWIDASGHDAPDAPQSVAARCTHFVLDILDGAAYCLVELERPHCV